VACYRARGSRTEGGGAIPARASSGGVRAAGERDPRLVRVRARRRRANAAGAGREPVGPIRPGRVNTGGLLGFTPIQFGADAPL